MHKDIVDDPTRRGRILARLWELANLSPEATRGSIAGQVKAISMIVAIEGLIPDRRHSQAQSQPATPPVKPQTFASEWLPQQQEREAEAMDSGEVVAATAETSLPEPLGERRRR
jgi:hypothetical protein